MIKGWYYLHENKDLIYKNSPDAIADIRDSDLCHSAWPCDPADRANAWQIVVEAMSLGAKKERIYELVKKWKLTDEDAVNYAKYLNLEVGQDGNQKTAHKIDFENLQEDPCGFGDTYLEAMVDLCKQLGFKGGKMWNATFKDLIKQQ